MELTRRQDESVLGKGEGLRVAFLLDSLKNEVVGGTRGKAFPPENSRWKVQK